MRPKQPAPSEREQNCGSHDASAAPCKPCEPTELVQKGRQRMTPAWRAWRAPHQQLPGLALQGHHRPRWLSNHGGITDSKNRGRGHRRAHPGQRRPEQLGPRRDGEKRAGCQADDEDAGCRLVEPWRDWPGQSRVTSITLISGRSGCHLPGLLVTIPTFV